MRFAVENNGGSQFFYDYLNVVQPINISEPYATFIEAFHGVFQLESVPLLVISQDGYPLQREEPLITENIVHAYSDSAGSKVVYSETHIGISPAKKSILLVSQTLDEILSRLRFAQEAAVGVDISIAGLVGYITSAEHGLGNIISVDFFRVIAGEYIPVKLYYKIHTNNTIEWQSGTPIVTGVARVK